MQFSLQLLVNDDIPFIFTLGFPGDHGVAIAGIQGIGVNTPNAAAVADATVGLAKLEHIPISN